MTPDIPAREESPRDSGRSGAGAHPRWLTILLAAAALLAAALLGATGGLLLAASGAGNTPSPHAVDVGFAQDMTVHHEQGVAMAGVARERSEDPEIRQLAFDIERGQTEQMGRMRAWLGLWSQPMTPTSGYMSWMRGPEHGQQEHAPGADESHPVMPGMATSAELDRLRSLSGRELDIYFLKLMIRHHQGGAPMMREAVQRAAVGEVRNLAERMLAAQSAEAEVMTTMLHQRGGTPLPAPQ